MERKNQVRYAATSGVGTMTLLRRAFQVKGCLMLSAHRQWMLTFIFLIGGTSFCIAQQTVYKPLELPGLNSAELPAPRDDWYRTVQQKFDRYSGKHADIVFDGDSITSRWETTGKAAWGRFADRAADFGIEGDRTENLLWRLGKGQLDGVDPRVVVLMIGTNNGSRNTADQIARGIKQIVLNYLQLCPKAHILLMAVFPRGFTPQDGARLKVAAVNAELASFNFGERVSYVDLGSKLMGKDGAISSEMMPDGVHPTAEGYAIWADAIQPLIDQYAPKAN